MSSSAARRLDLSTQEALLPLRRSSRFVKRLIDLTGAAVLLLFSSPLVFVFACLIKLEDGGPVLYRRRVVGMAGAFDAFKLRSMRVDAEQILERDAQLSQQFQANFKLRNDPRITRTGAVMRRFSVDELPQLWNVLRGEMSLVGPRMISPAELKKFGEAAWIFNHVKPGLTGYWQISGRHELGYEDRVKKELWYTQNRSLGLDLMILLKTPLRVLRGMGES
ncbi:MAG TPA: sugar transferase [Candidatus Acidoferrales bacterium]|nr:sugar transferase [Candidatus Acidoferrales bacterium]